MVHLQAFQRVNHFLAPGQVRTACIGTKLALTREPHDDDASQNAEHDLRGDLGNEGTDAGSVARVVLQQHAIHQDTDYFCAAVEATKTLQDSVLRDYVAGHEFPTVMGTLSWDNTGRPKPGVLLVQWQNGQQKIIRPKEAATAQPVYPMPAWSGR